MLLAGAIGTRSDRYRAVSARRSCHTGGGMIMTQTEMRPAVQGDASALARFLSLTGKGDRAAFRLLYDATSRRLYGVILKIVRDPGASQEALQDVYLRIWQRAGSYR